MTPSHTASSLIRPAACPELAVQFLQHLHLKVLLLGTAVFFEGKACVFKKFSVIPVCVGLLRLHVGVEKGKLHVDPVVVGIFFLHTGQGLLTLGVAAQIVIENGDVVDDVEAGVALLQQALETGEGFVPVGGGFRAG